MKNPELAERMHFLKETEEGRRMLFGIEKEIYDDGRAEGREEGRAEGREEGRAEGREIGRAEGREIGRAEEKIETALNLIRMKLPLKKINQATGLAMDELRKLKAGLQPS